jgi:hypothetical protein
LLNSEDIIVPFSDRRKPLRGLSPIPSAPPLGAQRALGYPPAERCEVGKVEKTYDSPNGPLAE